MTTTVTVAPSATSVSVGTSSITATVSPATTAVTLSVGPVTLGAGAAAQGSGSPVGVTTADFIGQLYMDTDTGQVYVNFSIDNTSWVEIIRNY